MTKPTTGARERLREMELEIMALKLEAAKYERDYWKYRYEYGAADERR